MRAWLVAEHPILLNLSYSICTYRVQSLAKISERSARGGQRVANMVRSGQVTGSVSGSAHASQG
jgi:hypothetical protein